MPPPKPRQTQLAYIWRMEKRISGIIQGFLDFGEWQYALPFVSKSSHRMWNQLLDCDGAMTGFKNQMWFAEDVISRAFDAEPADVPASLVKCAKYFKGVTDVLLEGEYSFNYDDSRDVPSALYNHLVLLPNITHLGVESVTNEIATVLSEPKVTKSAARITHLNLEIDVVNDEPDEYYENRDDIFLLALAPFTGLERLRIQGDDFDNELAEGDERYSFGLVNLPSTLRSLDIESITCAELLRAFPKPASNITRVKVTVRNCSPAVFASVLRQWPNLEHLTLGMGDPRFVERDYNRFVPHMGNEHLAAIGKHCRRLQTLTLTNSSASTQAVCSLLAALPDLKELRLQSYPAAGRFVFDQASLEAVRDGRLETPSNLSLLEFSGGALYPAPHPSIARFTTLLCEMNDTFGQASHHRKLQEDGENVEEPLAAAKKQCVRPLAIEFE